MSDQFQENAEEDLWVLWGKIINEWETWSKKKQPQLKVHSKLELDYLGPLPASLLAVCLTVDPCAYREIEVSSRLEKVFLHHKQSTHQVEDS